MVLLAGDISPIDVVAHLPVLCEEAAIPYVYVPEKCVLGWATGSKRPTSCVMIIPYGRETNPSQIKKISFEYKEKFDECVDKIKDIPIPLPNKF